MTNPVLVEVLRGDVAESMHRGAVAVMDGDGGSLLAVGDVSRPVFPRSAVKSIQALPLIESGAADAFGLSDRQIALACASHSGEAGHAETALAMLGAAGLDETALECGSHWPMRQEAALELACKGGKPSALHNNCSGKHSGFICTCAHMGIDHRGYVGRAHPLQRQVKEAMEAVTGAAHESAMCGTDGCSIPTYAVPLDRLAHGMARMATGNGLGAQRARAARRIMAACMAEPWHVAGSARADTRMMGAGQGRIFCKTGAEGVYCAAIPELGVGIAVKCDDGASRAAEAVVATIMLDLMKPDGALRKTLTDIATATMTNWNGLSVGRLRTTAALPLRA